MHANTDPDLALLRLLADALDKVARVDRLAELLDFARIGDEVGCLGEQDELAVGGSGTADDAGAHLGVALDIVGRAELSHCGAHCELSTSGCVAVK